MLNQSALSRTLIASVLYFVSNLLSNLAYAATDNVCSVITTFQLCSVHSLWIDWKFNNKRPRAINIVGCLVLVVGVFAFNYVAPQDPDAKPATNPGAKSEWKAFLYANLSVLLFAFYQFMQECKLTDIPKEYVVGLQGLCMTAYGWIPFALAHCIGHEPMTMPSGWIMWLVVMNGVTCIIAEYCALFSVRKTSAFIFVGTLALSSPLGLAMHYMKHEMDDWLKSKTFVAWTWWYVPSMLAIVGGCCLVYYGGDGHDSDDGESKVSEKTAQTEGTQTQQNNIEIQVVGSKQRVQSMSTIEGTSGTSTGGSNTPVQA